MSSEIAIEILAKKSIEGRNWYLCKGNLMDYLSNLKEDFYEFAIQRKIVKNQYLDSLYQTVKSGDPIPVLTLTYGVKELKQESGKTILDMSKVEILDGLQRTFRLWAYKKLADAYTKSVGIGFLEFAKHIKSLNPLFFESGVITTSLIKEMILSSEISSINGAFTDFDIYFIVWAGLSEHEVVKKMLVLNAGQKAVSITHQFELLFLHFFDRIKDSNTVIELFREKDPQATEVKNGRRKVGQFMFSSFIVALQSFIEQKPQRVSTDYPLGIDAEDEESTNIYTLVFNLEYLNFFIELLVNLDTVIEKKEGIPGLSWFVKETTLSGVLAAIGTYIEFKSIHSTEELKEKSKEIFSKLENSIIQRGLNIESYQIEYSNISSRAINFGTFTRKAIMDYTVGLIADKSPNWRELFIKTQGGK